MKTKLSFLIMAVALFTNVKAQDSNLWFDVTFGDYPDVFSAAGVTLSDIGQDKNFSGTFTDNTRLTFDGAEFNFATNVYREPAPFTSTSEEYGDKTFEYAIQLRNGNSPDSPTNPGTTVTYIDFPELQDVGKLVLFAYCANATSPDVMALQKKNDDGSWGEVEQITAQGLNAPDAKNQVLTFAYTSTDPVSLRLTQKGTTQGTDRFLVRIFRIIVEKNSDASVKSPLADKLGLSVKGKTLSLSGAVNNGNLSVFDLTGKPVFSCKVNSNTIDLQDISAGVYIVKLVTEQGELTQKIVL